MIGHRVFDSPVGPLAARADDRALFELSFVRRRPVQPPTRTSPASEALLDRVERQLNEYFTGARRTFELPLDLQGPPFHKGVWAALLQIPYGETISYGELARRIGEPEAARAVGAANGANPIAIIVPCHRVIGSDGRLVGYGGGLKRKQILLDLEAGRLSLLPA